MNTDPARELAIQIEAQQDLYFFSRYMFKERRKYKWMHNWHHRVVCDALMKVFRGETKRLIINIPPRYSKTELAVINFMAWCFGKVPDCEFIHISYSATLAANNAFQTRNLVQETAFKHVFPDFKLRDDSKAKDDWRTQVGGVCYA
ncbi:terminase, partial [Acinetobacter chengduensis]